MDVKTLLANAPLIRRAWRIVPRPLKLPLIAIAAVVWFVRRRRGDGDGGGSGDTAA